MLLLYSNNEIVIVSSAIRQANLIITEKIEKEMMSLSPILRQMKEDGLIWFRNENDCRCMYAWNGSSIKVLPEEESARGNRCCILIAEEARALTKSKYDSIFREMLRPRNVPYRGLPEYQDEVYADKAKEIFHKWDCFFCLLFLYIIYVCSFCQVAAFCFCMPFVPHP